ncbi:unnamed protein product [Vitrella brassicaformis CCMP3155]|uniref:Uncharacterized protein n=2 Tax=Vitrella brassicaformis TaxID=1169539 RepID=A0A0G4EGL5_VITBC|nr:unnamed protein product [Vitrella brassicaformis CCMP3155]|eukprot:CEL94603.1 unnamed protein product [Vitrella brassicaformis CCMP3155]
MTCSTNTDTNIPGVSVSLSPDLSCSHSQQQQQQQHQQQQSGPSPSLPVASPVDPVDAEMERHDKPDTHHQEGQRRRSRRNVSVRPLWYDDMPEKKKRRVGRSRSGSDRVPVRRRRAAKAAADRLLDHFPAEAVGDLKVHTDVPLEAGENSGDEGEGEDEDPEKMKLLASAWAALGGWPEGLPPELWPCGSIDGWVAGPPDGFSPWPPAQTGGPLPLSLGASSLPHLPQPTPPPPSRPSPFPQPSHPSQPPPRNWAPPLEELVSFVNTTTCSSVNKSTELDPHQMSTLTRHLLDLMPRIGKPTAGRKTGQRGVQLINLDSKGTTSYFYLQIRISTTDLSREIVNKYGQQRKANNVPGGSIRITEMTVEGVRTAIILAVQKRDALANDLGFTLRLPGVRGEGAVDDPGSVHSWEAEENEGSKSKRKRKKRSSMMSE